MKRSDIFNRRHPTPMDVNVYPIYKAFVKLQKEIVENWKTEVINGMFQMRGYRDILDSRMDVTKDGIPIIRMKPMVGFDTQEEIELYIKFFRMYKHLTDDLIGTMNHRLSLRVHPEAEHIAHNQYMDKVWLKSYRSHVHKTIMAIKILVSAMNNNSLDENDLSKFNRLIGILGDEDSYIEGIDQVARKAGLASSLSIEFGEGRGHFFDYPDERLVDAYWNYAFTNDKEYNNRARVSRNILEAEAGILKAHFPDDAVTAESL